MLCSRLNTPYGARCFLTRRNHLRPKKGGLRVLMHLLALGAFRLGGIVLWARRRRVKGQKVCPESRIFTD